MAILRLCSLLSLLLLARPARAEPAAPLPEALQSRVIARDVTPQQAYDLAGKLRIAALPHAAEGYYLASLAEGPAGEFYALSLERLAEIADIIRDDSTLIPIAVALAGEHPPALRREVQARLNYLAAAALIGKGDVIAATTILGESAPQEGTLDYLAIRSLYAQLFTRQGKLQSAVKEYRDIYREPVSPAPAQEADVLELKDRAVSAIASIYEGLKRFDEAATYYQVGVQIGLDEKGRPRKGLTTQEIVTWTIAIEGAARAYLAGGKPEEAKKNLALLQDKRVEGRIFSPEADRLAMLAEAPGEEERIRRALRDRYRGVETELQAMEAMDPAGAWAALCGGQPSALPAALQEQLCVAAPARPLGRRLAQIEAELARLQEEELPFPAALRASLRRALEADEAGYERQAGLALQAQARERREALAEILQ